VTTNNEFGGVKIDANQSAFAVGSGNTVTNTVTNLSPELKKLFSDLSDEINKKLSGSQKEETEHDVKAIKEAVKSGNFERAKKVYSLLSDGVRTFASAIAIGSHFNWI